MADKYLKTRIINKHTTYDVATNNTSFIPKEGEIILVKLPSSNEVDAPTYLAKIGDGTSNLKALNWMAGQAADVYGWAKEAALKITGADATGNVITGITSDASGITVTKATVATSDSVATQITEAINKLDGTVSGTGFVSSISQTDGKVSATLRALTAEDIPSLTHEKISDFDTEVNALINAIVANYVETSDFNTFKTNNAAAIESAANGARDEAISTVVGDSGDAKTANTVYGAKAFATDAANTAKSGAETTATNLVNALAGTGNTSTVKANAEAIAQEIEDRQAAIEAEAKTRKDADDALDLRVDSLEAKVKDVTTVMDFVGAGAALPAVSNSQKGDVFVISSGNDAGKEYVFDGTEWVELGSTSATDTAVAENKADIAALDEYVGKTDPTKGLTADITALEEAVGTLNTFKNTTVPQTYETIAEADKVRTRVTNLETAVGDSTKGLTKAVADNAAAIEDITEANGTIDSRIKEAINALDVAESTDAAGVVISSIKETDGKIEVTRRALTADDIPTLPQAKVDGLPAVVTQVGTNTSDIAKRALQTDLEAVDEKVDAVKENYLKVGTTNKGTESNPVYDLLNQDGDTIIFDCGGIE